MTTRIDNKMGEDVIDINALRGKSAVAFGPRLRPMTMKGLSLDGRKARLMIECGYTSVQMPDGSKAMLSEIARTESTRPPGVPFTAAEVQERKRGNS